MTFTVNDVKDIKRSPPQGWALKKDQSPPFFKTCQWSWMWRVKKTSMESIYRALTLVKSRLVQHMALSLQSVDGFQTKTDAWPDHSSARACTRDPPLDVGNATESDETIVGRVLCLLDYSAHSVTTEKRVESQRLPQIHSERSYCVVCLVLVFTTVRFQSAMLGKKCFSFSKQHNVLVLCVNLPHRCKLIREMPTARRTSVLSIYSAHFRRFPKQWQEQHKEVQQHHTPSLSCFQ